MGKDWGGCIKYFLWFYSYENFNNIVLLFLFIENVWKKLLFNVLFDIVCFKMYLILSFLYSILKFRLEFLKLIYFLILLNEFVF